MKVNKERVEKPIITKLNFLPSSKLFGVSSMAIVAIGGASLLGIQAIHNRYQGVNNSQANIKTKNQSTKSFVSIVKLKSLDKTQDKIKKINYIVPLLSAVNSSKNNNFYQFKETQKVDFFSF